MNQEIISKVFCISTSCPRKPSCYINFYTLIDLNTTFYHNIPMNDFYRINDSSTMGYCTLDKYKED